MTQFTQRRDESRVIDQRVLFPRHTQVADLLRAFHNHGISPKGGSVITERTPQHPSVDLPSSVTVPAMQAWRQWYEQDRQRRGIPAEGARTVRPIGTTDLSFVTHPDWMVD